MADDAASPGFFSSLMSGFGSLFRSAPPDAKPDEQKPGETTADYATRRQEARFGEMKKEVDGLLQRYPATREFPDNDAYSKELQGIRKRGFNQQEEDAIMHTFAQTHGERAGQIGAALKGGAEEWQPQPTEAAGGGAVGYTEDQYNRANPPLPPGVKMPQGPLQQRDDQVLSKLQENWMKSGRAGGYTITKDKRGRAQVIPDPNVGFKT